MENESIWADRDDVGLTEDARPGLDEQLIGLYVEDCEPSVELYSYVIKMHFYSEVRMLYYWRLSIERIFISQFQFAQIEG